MRGRKPERLVLKKRDEIEIRRLLHWGDTPLRVARRARILLARASRDGVARVADTVAQDRATVWRVCARYKAAGLQAALYDAPRSGRPPFFSTAKRRQIERLACCAPRDAGWALTHWSTRSLAVAAVEQEIVPETNAMTISRLLRVARLRPHLWRYWKSTVWDEDAIQRALRILWVYERTAWLWQRGIVVLALDEKPNIQVLERARPTQLMLPGQIERQEFDYIRHGTVNMLVSLTLHTGHMGLVCLPRNDGEHFRPAVQHLIHPYGWAKRVCLILDNGPSHTSADTLAFFDDLVPRVRVLFTPINASWLNQAESLIQSFSARYLIRESWASKTAMLDHLFVSRLEYNRSFAHPFDWQWTRSNFRFWLNNTPGLIRCKTFVTDH